MFSSSQLSYLSILPSLPPKEIVSKVSEVEGFERMRNRETFWEKVWRKWVSPRLPNSSTFPIREVLYRRVAEAKELTPEQLLIQGSKKGILFYGIESLERRAKVSYGGNVALRNAAANGYLEIVRYLVESGANISAREDEALRKAAKNGYLETVIYLVERGANISANNNEAYWMALHYGQSHVVNYLISLGVDPRGLYH